MNPEDPVLCYVSGPCAYFTTASLEDQWGDDWNDVPYECNAGRPYACDCDRVANAHEKKPHHEIHHVYFEGDFSTPDDCHYNSPYSVEAINRLAIPWLKPSPYGPSHQVSIWAGTPLSEFIALVEQAGGTVYLPRETVRAA